MNPEDLLAYIQNFLGYGDPAARIWFVGFEERGMPEEQEPRLNAWLAARDLAPPGMLIDVLNYHQHLELMTHLGPDARYQRTWGQLSRVALAATGQPQAALQDVIAYQRDQLGRAVGDTALLELFPLPNRSTGGWDWADRACPEIPYLQNRPAYQQAVLLNRVASINDAIANSEGANVIVAYGINQFRNTLFGESWVASEPVHGFSYASKMLGEKLIVACVHPNCRGVTNEYFSAVGRFIHEYL